MTSSPSPTQLSPQQVYDNLQLLGQVDTVRSAIYRQQAIEVISDLSISFEWRQAICDRLNQANQDLALQALSPLGNEEESY